MITHRLLKRQLRKLLGEDATYTPEIQRLLQAVNDTYEQHDGDRKLLQRSMDISSEELIEANEKLWRQSEKQALVLNKLKDSIRALKIGESDSDLSYEDLLTLTDILEEEIFMRNRVEELLREREEGLRLIIESTKDYAIYTLDKEGFITSWNAGAERIKGFDAEEVIGRHFSYFYTPEDRTLALPQQMFEEAVLTGRCEGQGWRVRKDRTLFWADDTLTTLRDDTGNLKGFVKITRDITDRKQAEEALKKAKEAAEAANLAKSEFLANMSHEIRTPMNAVIGMTSLLLGTELDEVQHEFVETVRSSGEALLSIINDILDFSKIEAGKLTLEFQPFDLRACIEETLDLFTSRAVERGIELVYSTPPDTPRMIVGDVTRLRQVLVNLIGNAVKFTHEGEVVVAVHSKQDGDRYRHHFTVRDTGIGIPKNRMSRLFKSFSQVDSSNTRKYGGTGLGLVISKRLVEVMGGDIWVESLQHVGTTFHFSITAPAVMGDKRGQQGEARWAGKRALVLDDNASSRRALVEQLTAWHLEPVEAVSEAEALACLADQPPFDIALVDAYLPDLNGPALAAKLRAQPGAAGLRVVLLTYRGDRDLHDQMENARITSLLNKPVKQHQLHQALRSLFDRKAPQVTSTRRASPLDAGMAKSYPLRILLAEDNIINQKVALRLLEGLGYRADAVANGLEALQALVRQPYDVVLMDVQMPEMDGLEATRRIRHQFEPARQPFIIAITASALQEDRNACLSVGMDDYISKPMHIEELVKSLQNIPVNNGKASPSGLARVEDRG